MTKHIITMEELLKNGDKLRNILCRDLSNKDNIDKMLIVVTDIVNKKIYYEIKSHSEIYVIYNLEEAVESYNKL